METTSQEDPALPALRARFALLGLAPSDADLARMLPVVRELDAAAAALRVDRPFAQAPGVGPEWTGSAGSRHVG